MIRLAVAVALLTAALPVAAQSAQSAEVKEWIAAFNVDTMRASAGVPFSRHQSRHFVLYTEQVGPQATRMLDSLEAAFAHATTLLLGIRSAGTGPMPGGEAIGTGTITVFVTASRTRFARVMSPTNKGLWGRTPPEWKEAIILVVNDSVRSYARHEVMHAIGFRMWGSAKGAEWIVEGLATHADGMCQGVPIAVVARDLLREKPAPTIADVTERFRSLTTVNRHGAYVLAGSVVEFLWNTRGRDGVRRVWRGVDTLSSAGSAGLGFPASARDLTPAWHAYIERAAGTRTGPSMESLKRHGCG